mmetsp:Transcript_4420/g.14651  ORF Transcript_4420/g.14651 Transcript_4420/m.14651 type:complete len:216 (-) Transcript_4420:2860-3507(-)
MRPPPLLLLVALAGAQEWRCDNDCTTANNGVCDGREQEVVDGGSGFEARCPCGSDCLDCGTFYCLDDCGDGSRTCRRDGYAWCCDRSRRCGDKEGQCRASVSRKTRRTLAAVAVIFWTLFVTAIVVASALGCYCCYKQQHRSQRLAPTSRVVLVHAGAAPRASRASRRSPPPLAQVAPRYTSARTDEPPPRVVVLPHKADVDGESKEDVVPPPAD